MAAEETKDIAAEYIIAAQETKDIIAAEKAEDITCFVSGSDTSSTHSVMLR